MSYLFQVWGPAPLGSTEKAAWVYLPPQDCFANLLASARLLKESARKPGSFWEAAARRCWQYRHLCARGRSQHRGGPKAGESRGLLGSACTFHPASYQPSGPFLLVFFALNIYFWLPLVLVAAGGIFVGAPGSLWLWCKLSSCPSGLVVPTGPSSWLLISPGNLDSSLCFFHPSVSHDVLCI